MPNSTSQTGLGFLGLRRPASTQTPQVEPSRAITIHSVTETSPPEVEPGSPVTIHVIEDTHTFEGYDGETIWSGGYAPVDPDDGSFLYEADHRTSDPRAFYCKVAGAHHRPKALADKRFAVGSQIVLRPEPDNAHDPNAVGVWDAKGKVQVGYVPATLSPEVAAVMRSGSALGGQVIREFRLGSSRGERIGLHVIISPLGPGRYVFHDEAR